MPRAASARAKSSTPRLACHSPPPPLSLPHNTSYLRGLHAWIRRLGLQMPGALLASRYGGKAVLGTAVLLWSLCTIVTPIVAHSLTAIVTSRVVLGLCEGREHSLVVRKRAGGGDRGTRQR